jgi:hypothetical protein
MDLKDFPVDTESQIYGICSLPQHPNQTARIADFQQEGQTRLSHHPNFRILERMNSEG